MDDSDDVLGPNKNNIPKRPRSVAWNYFDKVSSEPKRARCRICGASCHHNSNTSNLFKHLRARHPSTCVEAENQRQVELELYRELRGKLLKQQPPKVGTRAKRHKPVAQAAATPIVKTEEPLMSNSNTVTPLLRKYYGTDKISQVAMRAFLKMITDDLQPSSIVNRKGFVSFVHTLDSRFELPPKKIIMKNLLPELAEETKNIIKLDTVMASYFTVTVECWDYQRSQSFMTLSAHYIKDSWEMASFVLETLDCTEERTETNVATSFKRITDEWSISDRIIALSTNAPDDIIASAILINGWEEMVCFGSTLNHVVENALMSVSEIVRIRKKTSDAVTYFEKSTKASETLAAVQQQHGLPVHKLKQENLRYWTSMYTMFERMVEQFEAVNTVLCFLGKDHMCLCDDEVELIRNVIIVLKPFESATKELCTEQYTCISKAIPIATLLQQVTSASITMHPGPQTALKDALISQMQTQFSNLETNYKFAVSTLLDPRFKRNTFTDPSALELNHQRLLSEIASVVQSLEAQNMTDANSSFTNDNFWNLFDQKVSEAGALKTATSEAENECKRYFKEVNIHRNANPLMWWKLNESHFPYLKVLAQKYLCIPATSIPSTHLFTKEGDVISQRREQIKSGDINTMIFLNKNLV